jgi:hypothetical protein
MSTKPQSLLTDSPFQVRIWQPGYTYLPGDVVQPTTTTNSALSPPTNADFVASLTGWTAGTGYSWDGTKSYNSTGGAAKFAAGSASAQITNGNQVAVTVGQKITGQFYGMMATADPNGAYVNVRFVWYDSGHTLLSTTDGQQIVINTLGGPVTWWKVTATGTAPAGAAFCAIAAVCDNSLSAQHIWIDAFYWDYLVPGAGAQNFFTDITTVSATSGTTEPDWTNGGTNTGNVTDGGITWARGQQTIIYWYTIPFCLSGTIEPTWHTNVGGATSDGGVPWLYGGNGKFFDWICHTPQVQDANCPQNKYVALASSKIFSAAIKTLCGSLQPRIRWTGRAKRTQVSCRPGCKPTARMKQRQWGCIAQISLCSIPKGCKCGSWTKIRPTCRLLTALPIGSIWHKALAPVNNDLFFPRRARRAHDGHHGRPATSKPATWACRLMRWCS